MRRLAAVAVVLVFGIAACDNSGQGGSLETEPGSRSTEPTISSVLPPSARTAQPNCFLKRMSEGLSLAEIERQCDLDTLIDGFIASVQLRQGIAAAFNATIPGLSMTAKNVVDWEALACNQGAQVVRQLVNQVRPTMSQRIELLSPLLDFAGDTPRSSCPKRAGIGNEMAHEAWLAVLGSSPTLTASDILKGQTRTPLLMAEIFRGAHKPCDVIGNGVVVGLREWSRVDLPDLMELALSTFASVVCGRLLK